MAALIAKLLESKTFLAFVICLTVALALVTAGALVRKFAHADLPYVNDLLDWLLKAFGILVGRNVLSDGLPRVVDAVRGNGETIISPPAGLDALRQLAGQAPQEERGP